MNLLKVGGCLMAGLLLTQPVNAATYYADAACAVQGDGTSTDCASGTGEAGAFALITEGLAELEPGDVLQLAAGTYDQRIVIQVDTNAPEGTEDDPIVIRGAGTGQTIVRGDNLDEPTVLIDRSYWTLEELTVQNGEGDELAEGGCIKVRDQISGVVLRKLVVDGQGKSGGGIKLSCLFDFTACPQGTLIEDVLSHDHLRPDREDAHCVSLNWASREEYGIADTVIRRMTAWGCSGDGVQIIGRDDGQGVSAINTLIEDSTFYRKYDIADEENAIDVKSARGVIIRGNTMHGFRPTPTSSTGTVIMVHYASRDVVIENNIIYGGGQNIRVAKGAVYEPDDHPQNVIIRNNIIYNATKVGAGNHRGGIGNGITIAEATNVKLLHNTVVDSEGTGIEINQSATDVLLRGNLVVGSGADDHELSLSNSGNVTASHNLIWGNDGPGTVKGVADLSSVCPTCLNADPIFVDREGHDFHLVADSPAIDAGESMDEVVTDQEGTVRDETPNLGALESVSSVPPEPVTSSKGGGCITAHSGAPTGHLPVWMLTASAFAWLIRRRRRQLAELT